MKTDIFEDMKERVGCENYFRLALPQTCRCGKSSSSNSPLDYPKEQLQKFSYYVFGSRLCCYNGNTGNERK